MQCVQRCADARLRTGSGRCNDRATTGVVHIEMCRPTETHCISLRHAESFIQGQVTSLWPYMPLCLSACIRTVPHPSGETKIWTNNHSMRWCDICAFHLSNGSQMIQPAHLLSPHLMLSLDAHRIQHCICLSGRIDLSMRMHVDTTHHMLTAAATSCR